MKNQTPRWRKVLYRIVLFPVLLVGIAWLGLGLFTQEPAAPTGLAGVKSANVVVATTQAQMKTAATKIQAAVTSNKAIFIAIVDGAAGDEQVKYIDEIALKYKDQVQFIVTNSAAGRNFVQVIAPLTGNVAFPMMVIESPSGQKAAHVGMLASPQLDAFIGNALKTAP